jgi:osmoprotectant transport system permease protein
MPVTRAACAAMFLAALAAWPALAADDAPSLVVGSKRFTESYILGEIVAQTAAAGGVAATHRQGLGNTAVVFEALKAGAIDVYPEYTGTIDAEILKTGSTTDLASMNRLLAPMGLGVAVPLGFQNSYALGMKANRAAELQIKRVSDLAKHPKLVFGLGHEFIGRADGWPGMAERYGLKQKPTGIDHGIAYEALDTGRIDVTDLYTTDAKIAELGLITLDDDARYFPRYDAVLLYRLDAVQRLGPAWAKVTALAGRIDQARMIGLNGEAELRGRPFTDIARDFVRGAPAVAGAASAGSAAKGTTAATGSQRASFSERLFADDLPRLAAQHALLVVVAVGVATLIGIPLGAAAAAWPRLEQSVMAIVGLLQTVPSLALLAMLIPLLGRIGTVPALVALSLYALLPIVRNTTTGLIQVPQGLRDAGTALGLRPGQRWWAIDAPLALPVILAGVKTAAVIAVGTATIAAFIGAGGFGERITIGLALNDHAMLLAGALPAAAMALFTQGLFEAMEWSLRRRSRERA